MPAKTKRAKHRRAPAQDPARAAVCEPRTQHERQAEKQGVAAERRAIKKAARRHLKKQLLKELIDME